MRRQLGWLCVLPALASLASAQVVSAGGSFATATETAGASRPPVMAAAPAAAIPAVPDYGPATWVPANPANYSVANRPHDYPVQMIVIHDTESSYAAAIQFFQDPTWAGSAHYVVSAQGDITQMVAEKDIAWHAGNWDYNTRAIGIEHEGYACCNTYTSVQYDASAKLAASICSRWGVPMDRNHVIGHNEVPDPNNPGLYGGEDHHSDPGRYWDWNYYMGLALAYANPLPSPPRMMPDPVAVLNSPTSATVTWLGANTCHLPIAAYTVTQQPGNVVMTLSGGARSATFTGLTAGTDYTFTVTATNGDGQDTLTAQWRCNLASINATPTSPQRSGTTVQLSGTSTGCPHPLYQFWRLAPGSSDWTVARPYSAAATFSWNTAGKVSGTYNIGVWARDISSTGATCSNLGCNDFVASIPYTVNPAPCTSVTATAAPPTTATSGTPVTFTAAATGCPSPLYAFWARWQGYDTWQLLQDYSVKATYNWNSTGAAAGTEYIGVWAKDPSSTATGSFDANSSIPYSITTASCASVTVSAAPTSVAHGSGTHVAITAAATGCTNANPSYEFWMRPAWLSDWQLVQGYSTSATYDWNSAGAPAGTIYFGAWVKDAASPNAVDAFVSTAVTVT